MDKAETGKPDSKDLESGLGKLSIDEELARQLELIKLPSREDHAHENNNAAYGVETHCFLNVFSLSLENAPSIIYKYDLTFTLTKSNGDEFQLHNAMIKVNEHARSNKRNALMSLCRMMQEGNKDAFRKQQLGDPDRIGWRNCSVFDCGASYYTGVKIDDDSGDIDESEYSTSCYVKFYAPRAKGPIKWRLTLAETFRIDGENAKSQQALQFFDVLAMQKLIRSDSVDVKPDAAYLEGGDMTRDHKELRKGIVTASKVVGNNICIQMDSKISMFFKAMPLLDYIRKSCNSHSDRDLENFLRDRQKSRKLRKEMQNLPLRCRHIATKKTFECKGFSLDSATGTTFMLRDEEQPISVADYYERQYKYRLKFPNLPMVVERVSKEKQSYHPIECLDIAEGIRVSNQKMSKEAQENMIKSSCRAPAQLSKDMLMSREVAGLDENNKYLKSFNVKTTGQFKYLPGIILAKPYITGMGGVHPDLNDRGQIAYTKGGFRFADPAKPSKPITLIALDRAMRDDDVQHIKEELRRFAGDLGMQIEFSNIRDPCLFGGQMEPLRDFMMSQRDRTSMFFFLTKDKMDESHYMVKKLEQELGVVTQLICAQTAQGVLKRMRTTEYNVVAKMNQKLGGVVANPEVPPDLKKADPDAYAKAQDWFKNRMFVGFTLSHAGAQSFADRVVGEEVREPTCVGMAYTLGQAGKRSAMSWFQEKRKPMIDDITRHFVRALDLYAESNNKKMPDAIFIFRKGMSEAELKKAALEVRQVMEAIREVSMRPGMQDYRPTVQAMVCMANTADRLFYQYGDANVPCGTVLDKEATNPERLEFLIVPHNAIKGTAKAVKCTVVFDKQGKQGRRLEYPEMQSIFHAMCYLNGVAASPTRLPVPLSDSEKAAERQMNNFKEAMRNGLDDSMSMSSGRSGGGVTHDGSNDFYQRLSDQFAHKFKTNQYYA